MRIKRFFSDLLLVTGALLVLDAGLAVAWQEPVSKVYTTVTQGQLSDDLAELEERQGAESRERASTRQGDEPAERSAEDVRRKARALASRAGAGQGIGRIRIPAIDVGFVMVQGTDEVSLRKGPAHYTDTALPGERGTVGIAGHRTTYEAPFRTINKLSRGDRIHLQMPYGKFEYAVTGSKIVSPSAIDIFRVKGKETVALTACHPLYSDAERIVVFGERIQPELASKPEQEPESVPAAESTFAEDDSFGVPVALTLLVGLPAGLVGAGASVVGLQQAPATQRGGLLASLLCSVAVLAGFALVFLGVIG